MDLDDLDADLYVNLGGLQSVTNTKADSTRRQPSVLWPVLGQGFFLRHLLSQIPVVEGKEGGLALRKNDHPNNYLYIYIYN